LIGVEIWAGPGPSSGRRIRDRSGAVAKSDIARGRASCRDTSSVGSDRDSASAAGSVKVVYIFGLGHWI
jgi:type IV secretory pathway TrbD component